ncbi:hypothetical protein [Enterovirga rhinocerotis]|uniref:Uncharacterized protein n=1 Tax=Enterovirga rhinocerotis TaxID=1339210 RepID=A0A4R7CA93_9HYPH|nr:hypothetical protein [Enterovirga rhinocerotis]TDR93717.1 hypothetical protein EV668_0982 [Enterovirga rhinocerotis]
MDDIDRLISLIESARDEAARLGPRTAAIAARLEEAVTEARSLLALEGRADEGRRPEDLSSANDG